MDRKQLDSMLELGKAQPAILAMFGMSLSQLEVQRD
jgi:hypothetical protein